MDCELYLLLIQWLSTNVYRCTRPQATVTNPHTVLTLGSKETHIQSHNPKHRVGAVVLGLSVSLSIIHDAERPAANGRRR